MQSTGSTHCIFATDLHGKTDRYEKLLRAIGKERPSLVFLGGDLFPSFLSSAAQGGDTDGDFIRDFLQPRFSALQRELGAAYPEVLLILGNDDLRSEEHLITEAGAGGLWTYMHLRRVVVKGVTVYGYACVPPTPFQLKDWERYDVSQYVDPGCSHPYEGLHSVPVTEAVLKRETIRNDLDRLAGNDDLSEAIILFHTPPYGTSLDRAALDGVMVEHVPLDVHVGSIAVKRFIEQRQPRVTLHGHIHESTRLTGCWKEQIGRTFAFSAAHDGPELCVVRFSPEDPGEATRELI